jgi:hypothetical protein
MHLVISKFCFQSIPRPVCFQFHAVSSNLSSFIIHLFKYNSITDLSRIALGYGLDFRVFKSRQELGNFLFTTVSRQVLGAHPAFYPVGTRGSVPGSKAAGAWSWPLTLHLVPSSRIRGAIPLLRHTPSWRGAQLKHRDNLSLLLCLTLLIETATYQYTTTKSPRVQYVSLNF